MYCSSCGKEITSTSAFCPNCGKPTNLSVPSSSSSSSSVVEWEYRDFAITWNQGEMGWVAAEHYPEPAARMYYWQNIQAYIVPELQKLLDEGWQPLAEIGPACIQLRSYKSLEGISVAWVIIGAFVTFGVSLLFLPFQQSWKFQMVGFYVQLRRPKIMSQEVM